MTQVQCDLSAVEPHPPTAPLTILELRHHQNKGREIASSYGSLGNQRPSYSVSMDCRLRTDFAAILIISVFASTTSILLRYVDAERTVR